MFVFSKARAGQSYVSKIREVKVTSPDYIAMGDKVILYGLSNATLIDLNFVQFFL